MDVPTWVLVLEAAGMDPLRAAEIEEDVTQKWWQRTLALREALNKEMKRRNG